MTGSLRYLFMKATSETGYYVVLSGYGVLVGGRQFLVSLQFLLELLEVIGMSEGGREGEG